MKELERPETTETTGANISTPEKSEELISLLDEYIDQLEKANKDIGKTGKIQAINIQELESERDKLKENNTELKKYNSILYKTRKELKDYLLISQEVGIDLVKELQTLKDEVRKYIYEKEDNYPKLKELSKMKVPNK